MVGAFAGRLLGLGFLLGLSNCAVTYDQTTDAQITSITQEGDQQLATWQNRLVAKQTISYQATDYSKIQGDLQALEIRLLNSPDFETRDLAPIADSQVTLWNNIRDTQTKDGFVYDYLSIQQALFNYNMGLLTLYELTLKTGASSGSASAAVSKAQSAGPPALPKPAA